MPTITHTSLLDLGDRIFQAAGVPGEFHQAAAELYRRLAGFKDAQETPRLNEVLSALRVDPS